jgi:hypothetical protein
VEDCHSSFELIENEVDFSLKYFGDASGAKWE